jgi:hypothetical protein
MNDVLSGNTIFAPPQVGMVVRGKGFGIWGTFSSTINVPDGKAGEWWASVLPIRQLSQAITTIGTQTCMS